VACISAIIFVFIFYASKSFPSARLLGYFDYTCNPNQASMYFGFIGILAFHSVLVFKIRLASIILLVRLSDFIWVYFTLSKPRSLACFHHSAGDGVHFWKKLEDDSTIHIAIYCVYGIFRIL